MKTRKRECFYGEEIIDGVTWLFTQNVNNEKETLKTLLRKSDFVYRKLQNNKEQIDWKSMEGVTVQVIYKEKMYEIKIKKYIQSNRPKLIINVLGYYEIDFEIHIGGFLRGSFGKLINNIYASPKAPIYSKFTREQVIEMIGENLAKQLTWSSHKKINCVCLYCKQEKQQYIDTLIKYGLACEKCGGGHSTSERFMKCCFDIAKVNYEHQFIIEGYNYEYDFFLTDFKKIIELQGEQHYKTIKHWNKSLEEEQKNDNDKKNVAITHLVLEKNYHTIDCRRSEFHFLKNKFKSFFKEIGVCLTDEQYQEAYISCQTPPVVSVWDYRNKYGGNSYEIAKALKIPRTTVAMYLRRGVELGMCEYNGKNEIPRGKKHHQYGKIPSKETREKISNTLKGKPSGIGKLITRRDKYGVFLIDIHYNFEFVKMGFTSGGITDCCRRSNRHKTHKGYRFSYATEEEIIEYKNMSEKEKEERKERGRNISENKKTFECPQAKKIKCLETGQFFNAIIEAGEFYNIPRGRIDKQLREKSKHVYLNDGTKIHFEYVNQTE